MKDIEYSVAVDGKTLGPYKWDALQKLVWEGKLTLKTSVWKLGMDNWVECGTIAELKALFTPPPLPAAPAAAKPPPLPPSGDSGPVFE
jgi:hypothetical protein